MKKIVLIGLLLSPLAACGTIAGAGQDLQTAGAVVSTEARKAESAY